MEYMSDRGGLRREVEFLPDHRAVAERIRSGEGFTRPELAILMAYTKMGLYRRILETDFPNEPYFHHFLVDYFPTAIRERFRAQALEHQLRREITATQFTNVVVDLLGMTFVHHTIQDTGATPIQVIRASLSALEIVEAASFMERLRAFDNQVSPEHIYKAQMSMTRAVENAVNWMLLTDVDLSSLSDFITTYRSLLGNLLHNLREILPAGEKQRFESLQQQALAHGFSEDMADTIASFEWVPSGMAVIETGRRANMPAEAAARRYYELGERFSLSWLRTQLGSLDIQDKWERIATVGLTVELRRIQLQLVVSNQQFPSVDGGLVARYDQAIAEIRSESGLTLASGDVLARMLSQMAQGAHSHDPVTLAKQPALPGVRHRKGH
jgi:glutamate dehydrogenase